LPAVWKKQQSFWLYYLIRNFWKFAKNERKKAANLFWIYCFVCHCGATGYSVFMVVQCVKLNLSFLYHHIVCKKNSLSFYLLFLNSLLQILWTLISMVIGAVIGEFIGKII
jgi:hypothetical protein